MDKDRPEAAEYFREVSLIEAIQYTGRNYSDIYDWVMKWDLVDPGIRLGDDGDLHVSVAKVDFTIEVRLTFGFYLVRDVLGEFFYVLSEENFKKCCTSTQTPPF